jgi:hypothetical protein
MRVLSGGTDGYDDKTITMFLRDDASSSMELSDYVISIHLNI